MTNSRWQNVAVFQYSPCHLHVHEYSKFNTLGKLEKISKKTSLRKECNGYVVPESNANVTKAMVIYKNVPQWICLIIYNNSLSK